METPSKITCIIITPESSGAMHSHSTWQELAECVGGRELAVTITAPPAPPKAPATVPVGRPVTPPAAPAPVIPATSPPTVTIKKPTAPPTANQLYKIDKLGGSWRDATDNNRQEVSQLIDLLSNPKTAAGFKIPEGAGWDDDLWEVFPKEKAWRNGELPEYWASPYTWEEAMQDGVPTASPDAKVAGYLPPTPVPAPATMKSRLETMLPLLDMIPDGYYAIDLGDGSPIKYLRLDLVTHGRKKGARKVQTIHGDSLSDAWIKWPSGKVSVYWSGIEDLILALMSDHMSALRRYGATIGRCCRCNKRLTDERSRHYSIGPECEKYMPEVIHQVDLENGVG